MPLPPDKLPPPPEINLLPGRQPRAPDTGTGSSVTFSGLVLHYTCDDLVTTDTSGNSNTGVMTGSGTTLSTGLINNKLTFNGSGYIVPTNTTLLGLASSTSEISISCWINTTLLNITLASLRNSGNGNTIVDFVLGYNGVDNFNTGSLSILIRDDGGAGLTSVNAATAINNGAWHHCVVTRTTAKLLTLYVDGVSVASGTDTMTGTVTPNVAASAVGYEVIAGGRGIVGSLDDFQVYNRALTSTEVTAIYNGGIAAPTGYTLAAVTGTFALTGIASGTLYGRTLQQTTVGTFTLTWIAAGSIHIYVMPLVPGSFVFTGIAAGTLVGYALSSALGTFAFTGIAANLVYTTAPGSYVVTAAPVTFTFTGLDANLRYLPLVNYVLVCGTGQFYFTGLGVGSPGQGLLSGSGLGTPVVTILFGGAPVIDVTYLGPKAGTPVSEAAPGEGTPVTKVTAGGTPVVYI